jgi:hypothetical protein
LLIVIDIFPLFFQLVHLEFWWCLLLLTSRFLLQASRLAQEIQNFIKGSVEIFSDIDRVPSSRHDLLRTLQNMTNLLDTFPSICRDQEDKDPAARNVNGIKTSKVQIDRILNSYKPNSRLVGAEGMHC